MKRCPSSRPRSAISTRPTDSVPGRHRGRRPPRDERARGVPRAEPDGARDRPATFSRARHRAAARHLGLRGPPEQRRAHDGRAERGEPGHRRAPRARWGIDWLSYPPEPERVHAEVAAAIEADAALRVTCARAVDRLLELKRWAIRDGAPSGSAASIAEAVAGAALVATLPEPPSGPRGPTARSGS